MRCLELCKVRLKRTKFSVCLFLVMFQLFSQIFLVLPLSPPCIALSLLVHLSGEHKYSWKTFSSNVQTQRMLSPSYDGKMAFFLNEDVRQKLTYRSPRTVDRVIPWSYPVIPWASQSYLLPKLGILPS